MDHPWIKLEAVQVIMDKHKLYQEHLELMQKNHPASHRLQEMYHASEVLLSELLHLYSLVETRLYVGKHGNGPNPLENDDRFAQEQTKKDGKRPLFLYPRLFRFRTEPEFKNLNEGLEDPLAAEESKGAIHRLQQQIAQLNIQKRQQEADKNKSIAQLEGEKASLLAQLGQLQITHNTLDVQYQSMHRNAQAKDLMISDKAQTITRLEGENSSMSTQLNSLQQQQESMYRNIQTNNMAISEKTQAITRLEGEKGSLLIQLQTAQKEKGEAEQKMRHAQENHTSLHRVLVMADGRKDELVGRVTALEQEKLGLQAENKTLNEQIYDLQTQLQQPRSFNALVAPRQGSAIGSRYPSGGLNGSLGSAVSRERGIDNLYTTSTNPIPPSRQPASFGGNINRNPSASSASRPRQQANERLTVPQSRVLNCMSRMSDDQIQEAGLESTIVEFQRGPPDQYHHWRRGGWVNRRSTRSIDSNEGKARDYGRMY